MLKMSPNQNTNLFILVLRFSFSLGAQSHEASVLQFCFGKT